MEKTTEKIQWHNSVPIFRNTIILKQLVIAIGIPFGLISLVIGLTYFGQKRLYVLRAGLIDVLLFFTSLFIMAVYRGKYETKLVLDDKGAHCRTQSKKTESQML